MANTKQYDLEDRTFAFAKDCRAFVGSLNKTVAQVEDGKQLVRSSGSIAANYIEANEALSKKDFVHRLKIARKEAKESLLWLRLLNAPPHLQKECIELKKILSAIIEKV